jgi:glycosyltransferase involved in cell wall biosynthesis
MSADPLVSVICTARNASSTIEMTLQSIERQTFRSWEMIVVDDGSTDHTPALVEPYGRRDPRMRLIRTAGVGRAKALNQALSCARAEYVANLDADDLSHPRRLAIQYETMRKAPEIALLCN